MRRQIEARLATLRVEVDAHMLKSQAWCKSDYNCQTRKTPLFLVGSYVFVGKPSLTTTLESSADALASNMYNKF